MRDDPLILAHLVQLELGGALHMLRFGHTSIPEDFPYLTDAKLQQVRRAFETIGDKSPEPKPS